MFEVQLTTNKMAGFASVWTSETYESAWNEFLNQIEESVNDEYIEIQFLDISDCVEDKYRYKGILLYRFVKDEIDGYENHGTLYEVGADGEEIECKL